MSKQNPDCIRKCIIEAAEMLFDKYGIDKTTMDDIAKASDYSKATLYAYFKNKEEVINTIALSSIKMLYDRILCAIANSTDIIGKFFAICNELMYYQAENPFYFKIVTGQLPWDIDLNKIPPTLQEIYDVGEMINIEIAAFIQEGIDHKLIRSDIKMPETVFLLWASISGTIKMAAAKQQRIRKEMDLSKEEFLAYGFETILKSITIENK